MAPELHTPVPSRTMTASGDRRQRELLTGMRDERIPLLWMMENTIIIQSLDSFRHKSQAGNETKKKNTDGKAPARIKRPGGPTPSLTTAEAGDMPVSAGAAAFPDTLSSYI
ncbi:hypothetical protein ACH8KY_005199 [Salmonella enterica subsp. enterica serovar Braenderup]|uniref:hypothetical protein n=1 Tax=Salmonella enterica TaxID=28901 RepID=UPI001482E6BC|nr:hypothetical protein [Salmonella enterica]